MRKPACGGAPGKREWPLLALALLSSGCAAGSPLLRPAASPGQRPSVVGVVLEEDSEKRIPYCRVIVLGTSIGAESDARGEFALALPDTGRFELETRKFGYETQKRGLRVVSGRVDTVTFHLKWKLPPGHR